MSSFRHRARRRTAYHEAGHAVIALHHNVPLHGVSIIPGEDSLGAVEPDNPVYGIDRWEALDVRRWRWAWETQFCIVMAGARAQRLVAPKQELEGAYAGPLSSPRLDYAKAADCIEALTDDYDAWIQLACNNRLVGRTDRILRRHRRALDALAHALLRHGRLKGRRALRVVGAAGLRPQARRRAAP
jgi:hypothetical protein